MLSCTTDKYSRLYARWLARSGELLDYARMVPEDTVLDLCGGTGAVSLQALARGAKEVHLLDLNPRINHPKVKTVAARAETAPNALRRTFSLVVCRQALGYLNPYETAEAVYDVMEPGGRFVLNNFLKPRWGVKWYRYEGHRFLEVFGYLGHHVVHVQASPSIGVDVTHFRWHSHETVMGALLPWFHVKYEIAGSSVRYFCQPKRADLAPERDGCQQWFRWKAEWKAKNA